jgi:nucleoside diphosphate kinase
MSTELTFSIIKPNAIKKNAIGPIIAKFEENGLKIAAAKLVTIDRPKCEEFYAEHKERPFFGELVDFMTSGPVMLMALSGEGAIMKNREIMGQQTLLKLLMEQFASFLATVLVKMQFMAVIHQRVQNASCLCFLKSQSS